MRRDKYLLWQFKTTHSAHTHSLRFPLPICEFPVCSVFHDVVSSINIKNLTVIDQFVDDVMKGKDL